MTNATVKLVEQNAGTKNNKRRRIELLSAYKEKRMEQQELS